MFLILFRSVALAVIGILPNLLAAAIVLGFLGLAGIPLDMMTITIAAITIGIAVDNGIHYISSPEISTTCPSPALARSQRRSNISTSSSRPTSSVR